jgi:hypothetical protein
MAARVSDMDDPNFIAADFVVDVIGIPDDRQLVDARLVCFRRHMWKAGEHGNTPLNDSLDRLRNGRGTHVEIRYR